MWRGERPGCVLFYPVGTAPNSATHKIVKILKLGQKKMRIIKRK
jgi:hypothetical protein